jgi:hypothetical protein
MPQEASTLENLKDYYDGIVVSGHIAAYVHASVTSFLEATGKPFFVDPVTHLLAGNDASIKRDDGKLKKSIEKLSGEYGQTVRRTIQEEKRTLRSTDFMRDGRWNQGFISEFVRSVLKFQRELMATKTQKSIQELLELAGDKDVRSDAAKEPSFLVAPYFCADSLDSNWYRISLKLAKEARIEAGGLPLFGVVCIDGDILRSKEGIQRIISDWHDMDGILVWISKFKDSQPRKGDSLDGYVRLVRGLLRSGRPIYVLHGGFPSFLMLKDGLMGVCSGVCYGEYKNAKASRAGGPTGTRYYVPFAKVKIQLQDARRMYATHASSLCSCELCKSVRKEISEDDNGAIVSAYFRKMELGGNLKGHYAVSRHSEVREIETSSLPEAVGRWRSEWKKAEPLSPANYGLESSIVDRWSKALGL